MTESKIINVCNDVSKPRVLYCALKWNYAKKEEGLSYESVNLEAGLKDLAEQDMLDLDIYHIDENIHQHGHEGAAKVFMDQILAFKPTIIFHVPFDNNYDLDLNILKQCVEAGMKVLSWDCDASWRQDFILPRKSFYTHFITTHSNTIEWYKRNGMNFIRSQWGGSPLYPNDQLKDYEYDVSFVGQNHSIRPQIIGGLNQAGIKVHLFGNYWNGHPDDHGYISFDEMIKVFNSSKINLNLSNPFRTGTLPQIKGRHFEIPQCGGFQLTTPADDIESYFVPDKEIVLASSIVEIVDKIRYYLSNDDEREKIAEAGSQRMVNDHQWKHRFEHILKEIENGSA